MKFKVERQHYGDKQYFEGDEREAAEEDVAHLVKSGILSAKNIQSDTLKKVDKPLKNKGQ